MDITPIKKVSVGEQVFQQLKLLIFNNKWLPGDKIPSENEMAKMFNVSRITVRHALQKLNALGLLETRLGEGSFVKRPDISESMNALLPTIYLNVNSASDILQFRIIIDTECARLAASLATDDDIEDLKDIVESMIQCKNSLNLRGFAKADLDFHFKIGRITRNSLIIKTNLILRDILDNSMIEVIDKMGCESGIYYHEKILQAIQDREETTAMSLMREHLLKNTEYFLADGTTPHKTSEHLNVVNK